MSDDGFTPDQRVALRILHEEYTDLTHAERAKAFNAAFADELRKRGWPSGRKAPEQRAHYRTNDQPSHANLWNNLHRGPGYKNGRSLHRKVSARIKEAVKVTGMPHPQPSLPFNTNVLTSMQECFQTFVLSGRAIPGQQPRTRSACQKLDNAKASMTTT